MTSPLDYSRDKHDRPNARQVLAIFSIIFAGCATFWLGFGLLWWQFIEPTRVPPINTTFTAMAAVACTLVGVVLGFVARIEPKAARASVIGLAYNTVMLAASLAVVAWRVYLLRH
ncbi:MAG: hypothetical protein QM770_22900 [Tepidisphaeraceae bacterium]